MARRRQPPLRATAADVRAARQAFYGCGQAGASPWFGRAVSSLAKPPASYIKSGERSDATKAAYMTDQGIRIPVARPRLPGRERLLRYLDQIDRNRWYSNFGPLVREFERRLAAHLSVPAEAVATVSNATIGLTLALRAVGAKPGTLCVLPSWTFSASAHAVVNAGLRPYFVDVDEASWQLTPEQVLAVLDNLPGVAGSVMPIAPLGAPIDRDRWNRFRSATGIPVVIDAAAAFDSLARSTQAAPGPTPQVVSLHATKILGIGEGGFVVSTDPDIIKAVRVASNFGLAVDRSASSFGLNAKLSEYGAAVGLAALDEWPVIRGAWQETTQLYRDALRDVAAVSLLAGQGDEWLASTLNVRFCGPWTIDIAQALLMRGIDTRRWWGDGCHRQPAFRDFDHDTMTATERLSASVLGLPLFLDMGQTIIKEVVAALCHAGLIAEASRPTVPETSSAAS